MGKESFWLFKKTQIKISKNTLWRVNFLALSGEPIKIAMLLTYCSMKEVKYKGST